MKNFTVSNKEKSIDSSAILTDNINKNCSYDNPVIYTSNYKKFNNKTHHSYQENNIKDVSNINYNLENSSLNIKSPGRLCEVSDDLQNELPQNSMKLLQLKTDNIGIYSNRIRKKHKSENNFMYEPTSIPKIHRLVQANTINKVDYTKDNNNMHTSDQLIYESVNENQDSYKIEDKTEPAFSWVNQNDNNSNSEFSPIK